MSKKIIEIENLSKKYILTDESTQAASLKEAISTRARDFYNRVIHNQTESISQKEFWALQDVNLSIEQGTRVGIIGKNGSGKSTLLKILSRVTEPTTGRVRIRGRVASLLEVGTGFHPELSGKENIYLNGAVLGMSHQEIKRKYDEIVAFSEVEDFLDTPVKRYSSGMYTRLGFAIAAHVDPELLIVDEVLSVGDAEFQDKCLKKMQELGESGRTILFVSHDVRSVLNFCNQAIFLEKGRVKQHGNIEECVNAYIKKNEPPPALPCTFPIGDERIRFNKIDIIPQDPSRDFFYQGESITVEMEYELFHTDPNLVISLGVNTQRGELLATATTFANSHMISHLQQKGKHRLRFNFDTTQFYPADYILKVDCSILQGALNRVFPAVSLKLNLCHRPENFFVIPPIRYAGAFLGNNWSVEHD